MAKQIKFRPLGKTLCEEYKRHFTGYEDGLFRGDPGGFVMTQAYGTQGVEEIRQLSPRADDVYGITFPKSGELLT